MPGDQEGSLCLITLDLCPHPKSLPYPLCLALTSEAGLHGPLHLATTLGILPSHFWFSQCKARQEMRGPLGETHGSSLLCPLHVLPQFGNAAAVFL